MKAVEVQAHWAGETLSKSSWDLFLIIFNNVYNPSGGSGSLYRNGTCFTTSECENKGGSIFGSCAAGFVYKNLES